VVLAHAGVSTEEEVNQMTKTQQQAMVGLGIALLLGSMFQLMAKHDAAVLGLSALELALLGGIASAAVTRAVKA
jgi:hypothetical protein